jgi:lipopolysaccharide/colanic/teichoic acid biosynthesis glycosyltransferase
LTSPLLALAAVAIKLDDGGPVFYRQRRVGRDGAEFELLKLRTMDVGAEQRGAGLAVNAGDPRITRSGRVLRRVSLDELPQLWNVVRGEMSLVGPRPEDPTFVALYPREFASVLEARPGITGPSQLVFAREDELLERSDLVGGYVDRLLPAKLAIDALYVRRQSVFRDTLILAWTAAVIVGGVEVAVDRRTGRLSVRRREPGVEPWTVPERPL